MTTLEHYESIMEECGEQPEPIERLRFFLSIALTGQDWLDVEPFIDGISQQLAAALAARNAKDGAMLAVLCDPEGNPCFAGSDGDRKAIADALAIQPDDSALKAFADKVREQCAKVCEMKAERVRCDSAASRACAAAIRATKELP